MKVSLVGCGCGAETLTAEAAEAIARAELVIGSERMIREHGKGKPCVSATRPEEIVSFLRQSECESAAVLLGGDTGFYSGAKSLLPMLSEERVTVIPGISSLQVFAARLGRDWQSWNLCSSHGRVCNPVREVCKGKPAFFLTGTGAGPSELCAALCEAGLNDLPVTIGENLGTGEERIHRGIVEDYVNCKFSSLSVLLAEKAPRCLDQGPGIRDDSFERTEKIPMTKREIRAVALSLLNVGGEDVCWDIGAGTGSVSIELALRAGEVYGIERDDEALALAERNRRKLGAWNLKLIRGQAPEALEGLPTADRVFIGGSGGHLKEILGIVGEKCPRAGICVSVITLETLHTAVACLEKAGYRTEVLQLSASRSRTVGGMHMMTALNPVFLISGARS